jgi:glycosyltransferase involved in cell wall biosynthesis
MQNKFLKLLRYNRYFIRYWQTIGLKKTLMLCIHKLIGTYGTPTSIHETIVYDIGSYKTNIMNTKIEIKNEDNRNIPFVWYVPFWTNVWGGGHLTIFRFAHLLSKMGHPNYIYIYNTALASARQLEKNLQTALPGNTLKVLLDPKEMPEKYLALGTTWQSTYEVVKHSSYNKKFYFMQDYESYFYAFGTESLQANASYELGFHGITGGTWLKKCYEQHGGKADNYIFSVDPTIFYARKNIGSDIKRLFFYGRPTTERRAYALGIEALRQINKAYPEIEILIAGLDGLKELDFPAQLLGNLTLKQTGELYRTCDVGFALSGTNLSYLPVELMASGVPVITNNGPNVEWFCENLKNSLLCDPFPSAFVEAIRKLKDSPALRLSLAEKALEKISQTSWENEAKKIYGYIHAAIE